MKALAFLIPFVIGCYFISCRKYLDDKPNIKLAIPATLSDFQQLLDNPQMTDNSVPGAGDLGCDDYYLDYDKFQSLPPNRRNCYIWASDIWEGAPSSDWNAPYAIIYVANVVLESLNNDYIDNNANQDQLNAIRGHALFLRATHHYYLQETFGQPYKPSSANSDLGIPLKLTSNLANISFRSSVQAVFDQIIADLKSAAELLPNETSIRSRPSKAAAFAMLARVYLTIQNYSKANEYANASLQINNTLFDFNDLTDNQRNSENPFSSYSPPNDFVEVLYPSYQIFYNVIGQTTIGIDTVLINSYDSNDLRRSVFYNKNTAAKIWYFKGYYSGTRTRPFVGPAVDEMYLIRAECFARLNNIDSAMDYLNALLTKRYVSDKFMPIDATDARDALQRILLERRKELVGRGVRWSDLRRLNQDADFAVTLFRTLNSESYTLPPNDKKYAYPIPDDEIRLSGIQQNPR